MIEYSKIRRISSEFKHRYRIFNEIRVDCDAIKNVFDILLPETFKNGIKGFVQETSINPFKMTLFSEIQVNFETLFFLNTILNVFFVSFRFECGT